MHCSRSRGDAGQKRFASCRVRLRCFAPQLMLNVHITAGRRPHGKNRKGDPVWTIIHSRFKEARNAIDPESTDALVSVFLAFDTDASASVAVLP